MACACHSRHPLPDVPLQPDILIRQEQDLNLTQGYSKTRRANISRSAPIYLEYSEVRIADGGGLSYATTVAGRLRPAESGERPGQTVNAFLPSECHLM